jgi:RimJ/RimL family protein N-acetyltransferase
VKEKRGSGQPLPLLLEQVQMAAESSPEQEASARQFAPRPLTVAPLRPQNAASLLPLLHSWDVVKMLAEMPWPVDPEYIDDHAQRQVEPNPGVLEFLLLAEGTVVGSCAIKKPGSGNPTRQMPRLGYWIGQSYWRRGYGTQAVSWLITYAFRNFPQHVVGAGVFEDNIASRGLLEKLGFTDFGHYKLYCRSRGGQVNVVDMHLSRSQWASRSVDR